MAILWGTENWDYQSGGSANDIIYGYGGGDRQNGWGGSDYLYGGPGDDYQDGGSGSDYLHGGAGSDHLYGGQGADRLVGGYDSSRDDFRFGYGDSPSYNGYSDMIYDFTQLDDYIEMPIAGTYYNYREASTAATSIASARAHVEGSVWLRQETHVFLYNARTDTGYLLSNLDRNGSFETGVVLSGAGSAYDMGYSNIIAPIPLR